jgi:hypothetical protein
MSDEPHDRILLVEGRDDAEVVKQFCNHHRIDNRRLFKIEIKQGIEALLDDLRVRPRGGVQALGIILDADPDPEARWRRLSDAMERSGYALPEQPGVTGTFIPAPSSFRPRVGVWMMPDNRGPGTLEDFLLQLTDDDDPLLPGATAAVDGIEPQHRRFPTERRSKAVVHTWLAWQEEPGTPLGLAITRRYLDPARAPAPAFRYWLLALFAPTEAPH